MQLRNPTISLKDEIFSTIKKMLIVPLFPIVWSVDAELWLEKRYPRAARLVSHGLKYVALVLMGLSLALVPYAYHVFHERSAAEVKWKGVVQEEQVNLTFSTDSSIASLRVGDARATFHMDGDQPVIHGGIQVFHPKNWWYTTTLIRGHRHTNTFISYGPYLAPTTKDEKVSLVFASIQAWRDGKLTKVEKP